MPKPTEQVVLELIDEDQKNKHKDWKPGKETRRLGRLIGL